MEKVDEAEPESGIGTDEKIEETYEIVTEEDVKDIKSDEIQEEPKEHILVIGHDIHLNFDQPKETEETAAESTDVVKQVVVDEPVADEQPEVQICEAVTEVKSEVTEETKVSKEPEVSEESKVAETEKVSEEVSEKQEVLEETADLKSEPEVAVEDAHEVKEELTEQTDKKSDLETDEQPESEDTKKTEQNGPVRASSLTESEVAKAVIAQALENRVDEEDNKPAPRPVKDHTATEITKDHEVLCKRSSSVRQAARMFQNVAEQSAVAKPSTPQSVRKMPNRKSIQTDQPSQHMAGVVRVAVPIPENYKEKKVTPQVIPPPPKSIYDDKYADKETRKSTYDNMINDQQVKEVKQVTVTEEIKNIDFQGQFKKVSTEPKPVKNDNVEVKTESTKPKIESPKPKIAPKPVQEIVDVNQMPFEAILSNLDFELEPKEFTCKAEKKTKQTSLGLSIIDGEKQNPDAVFVTSFSPPADAVWTGDVLPRAGDVLVTLDGTWVTRLNVDRLMMDTGNTISLKFHRFPGSFTGCE